MTEQEKLAEIQRACQELVDTLRENEQHFADTGEIKDFNEIDYFVAIAGEACRTLLSDDDFAYLHERGVYFD